MGTIVRPVERGAWPSDSNGTQKTYAEYGDAQPDLYHRLGEYCSYCELCVGDCLHVEHILPKAVPHYQHLELHWPNFLLACTRCNSTKGHSDIDRADYFWPDTDNTFRAFRYERGGIVRVEPSLTPTEQQKARRTLNLTGIDRRPGHPRFEHKDRRWQKRLDVGDKAVDALNDIHRNNTPELTTTIVDLARATGFWSVWMTVFQSETAMLARFVAAFPGTCTACFDAGGMPQARPGGSL